jgi:hypothetical protein
MSVYQLKKARGRAKEKLVALTVKITGTGSVDTGLSKINSAVVSVIDSGSAIPTRTASITSIDGGVVNIVVTEHGANGNSIATSEATVALIAVGE